MKKLLFAVSALAALSLLAPTAGFAQAYNQIGIYLDEAGTTVNASPALMSPVSLYLIATLPYGGEGETTPITLIKGFETGISLSGSGTFIAGDVSYPDDTLNMGDGTNIIAGYSSGVNPSGGSVLLATLVYYVMNTDPIYFNLVPTTPSSIDGSLVLLDWTGYPDTALVAAHPASGDYADPVFAFNAPEDIVATESSSFSNIKAMYR